MAVTLNRASSAVVSFSTPQEIIISHLDDSIRIGNGTNLAEVTATGALKTDGSGVTQPISAAALPLPSGAATETTLSSINGKLNSLGQKAMTGSVPVVVASDQTVPISAASLPLPTGAATETTLSSINGKLNSLGQKTMASSVPVVLASDQNIPTRTEPQRGAVDQTNFSIFAEGVNSQTAETKLLSIENPIGSGKTLYIYSLTNFVDPGNNNFCRFRYYNDCSTPSAGTLVTPVNLYSGSVTTSVATVRSLPTVTTLAGKLTARVGPAGNTQGAIYYGELLQGYWILPPGKNFVITGQAKANNTPTFIGLEVIEK